MRKLFTTLCVALSLSACAITGTAPTGSTGTGPALTEGLRATNADEQGVKLAFDGFDALLSAVDVLRDAGVIQPGSPRALRIQSGLVALKGALNAFAAAQRAGNAETYQAAFVDARRAFNEVRALIQETRQ